MKKFFRNSWLGGITTFLFFEIIAFCYAASHHAQDAYIQIAHFINKDTYYLSGNIQTAMVVTAFIFLIIWVGLSYIAGKFELKGIARGMLFYSALSLIGALCIPLAIRGNTFLGMLSSFLFFPWSAPLQPLFITEGSLDSFLNGIVIAAVIMPLLSGGIYYFVKQTSYHNE